MDPYDKSVMKLVKYQKMFCKSRRKLVEANDTHLKVQKKAFPEYSVKDGVECYYVNFWRVPPKNKQADKQIAYNKTKNYFNDSIAVSEEFVKVICSDKENKQIYLDFFAFVPIKEVPSK